MASNVRTTAGSTIAISANQPASYDASGFGDLTFTTISDVTDLGEFGRTYNLVTHNPIADRRTVKRKGSFNDGAVSMQLGRDGTDAGQQAGYDALDTDDSVSIEITLQSGTKLYFTVQVMSFTYNLGNVDSITGGSISMEIDNDIVVVNTP